MSAPYGDYTDREEILIERIHELEDIAKLMAEALEMSTPTMMRQLDPNNPINRVLINAVTQALTKYKELNDEK